MLQFMYHGEVCISQEGLSSLVKCAELLQVKGLCGNETTSIISTEKESSPLPKNKTTEDCSSDSPQNDAIECSSIGNASENIEIDANDGDSCAYNDQMIIKRELNISEFYDNDILAHANDFFFLKVTLKPLTWTMTTNQG